jgi:uncharacterized protein YkwD
MGKLTKPAVILGFILVGLACWSRVWGQGPGSGGAVTWPPPQIQFLQEVAWGIYWVTNEQRQRWGLTAMAWDESLAAAARWHAGDMLQRRFFSHVTPDGRSLTDRLAPGYARAGENIWSGSGMNYGDSWMTARAIVAGWLASPGHRDNILDRGYTHLGVGVAAQGSEIRATQDFVQVR